MLASVQAAPIITAHALTPARYIVIDIETGNPPADAIDAALAQWKPPANVKKEGTIEAKRAEAAEKIRDRAALLDSAPILCVSVKTDASATIFNGMDAAQHPVDGWLSIGCGDERSMLLALRLWLDQIVSPDTPAELVGHNVRGFDKPKLRHRYAVNRLRPPEVLALGGVETFDTMAMAQHFSVERNNDRFVSLDDLCAILDIPQPKKMVSGADVPAMHDRGEIAEILTYCCIDTAATEQAYLLMTGQHTAME